MWNRALLNNRWSREERKGEERRELDGNVDVNVGLLTDMT